MTRMLAMAVLVLGMGACVAGLSSSTGGSSTCTSAPARDASESSDRCNDVFSCDACLQRAGCVWTGCTCASECFADTSCFDPAQGDTCPAQ